MRGSVKYPKADKILLINVPSYLIYSLIFSTMGSLGRAPTILSTLSPSLNIASVGMLIIPYLADVSGASSTFSLQTFNFPSYSFAIS